jgi:hypothetical protein
MRSPNTAISHAAVRAFARIGKKAAITWPKTADPDSILRYADALRDSGATAEAMRHYKLMLARSEPHLQCAAIVGIARIGSPEAAAAIHPMLKSANSRVRITAVNAWKAMAARPA